MTDTEVTKEQLDAYADSLEPLANDLTAFAKSKLPHDGFDFMYVMFATTAYYLKMFDKCDEIDNAIDVIQKCQLHIAKKMIKGE